jgi:lysozyme family protein
MSSTDSDFPQCVQFTLTQEGGYSDDPDDPGGATNFGIILTELSAWRGAPVTPDDVQNMTVEEATAIYQDWYWERANIGMLPSGINLIIFDHGVNVGPASAIKALQTIVGTAPDGILGPITIGALSGYEGGWIIDRLGLAYLAHYQSLSTVWKFGRGWMARLSREKVAARAMLGASNATA